MQHYAHNSNTKPQGNYSNYIFIKVKLKTI